MRWMALLEDETYFRPARALYAHVRVAARKPEFWLTFAAYAIPLSFLFYVLYWNFLPFGYSKTFTIDVGSDSDTSGEFRLEPSRDLSERKTAEDGTTYRELNGIAYAIFEPRAILKDAEITVEVEGGSVEIIPPYIDFDPNSVEWNYSWDFTQGKTPEELGLVGNAFPFDGCMYFDGQSRLELPDSADKFEDGPFTVYAEWTPEDDGSRRQKIIGHYNWEIFQNQGEIQLTLGRLNSQAGDTLAITMPISPNFFNKKHYLIAAYNPSPNGYFELFVDGAFIGRTYLGTSVIWKDYGNKNLGFGSSYHENTTPFTGCITRAAIKNSPIKFQVDNIGVDLINRLALPIITDGSGTQLSEVNLVVNQNEIWAR